MKAFSIKKEKEKHIFFVHSPITFLVAWGVMRLKALNPGQVVFLTHRGFAVRNERFPVYEFPYNWSPEQFPFKLNFLKSWRRLKAFDDWVSGISSGKQFVLYLPHSEFRVLKLFISNRNCKEYAYLEEGLGSYCSLEMANPRGWKGKVNVVDQLLYKNRIKDKLIYNVDFGAVYALFEEAFPGFKNKVVLQRNFLDEPEFIQQIAMKQDLDQFNHAHIVVLDAVSIFSLAEEAVHLSAIDRLMNKMIDLGVKKVFVKFHPAQIGTVEYHGISNVLKRFKKEIAIEEIDQSVYLELIALHCQSVTFYVNLSSVGAYASKFGQQVYTWANYMMELDEGYSKKFYQLDKVFLDNVVFIED